MLDHLKGQTMGRRENARLMVLVGLALVVGVSMAGSRSCNRRSDEPESAVVLPPVDPKLGKPVPVDRERVLAVGDTDAAHRDDAYEVGALDYLLDAAVRPLAEAPRPLTTQELASVPFAEAGGRAYQTAGTVVEMFAREHRSAQQRLWTMVVQGPDGAQVLVVHRGLATDPREGAPRSVSDGKPWIQEGDRVAVRGLYLQRRSGTFGDVAVREPAPVLVLSQVRLEVETAPPLEDPARADWNEVEDRLMAETLRWEEPALFQVLQWAQARGPAKVREDVLSGKIPWKDWDRETFRTWAQEVEVTSSAQTRPFTDAARGKLWRLRVLVGQIFYEEWDAIPVNRQGVDHLYKWDVVAEDYTDYGRGVNLRCFCPFPPEAFPGVAGRKAEAVTVYGFFLKNHSYESKLRSARQPGTDDKLTAPSFIILHAEPVPPPEKSASLWWLAGSMVVLGALFYLTLIRGERREAKRMEVYRRDLRQRMRKVGQGPMAGTFTPAQPPSPDDLPPEDRAST
jgi:hypothetical protein